MANRKKQHTAEQKSAKLAKNVHWMVLYQICVFGADLKSNMAARVHNVFSLAEILKKLGSFIEECFLLQRHN
jgi:hypothetical protein